ncbi:hypothetical protein GCM10011490_11690 [Pseudoclavibacter endophyticus]|nr:hypothetical protein GCM10011490_11690 [Pseudoclavibacter endophyticus]
MFEQRASAEVDEGLRPADAEPGAAAGRDEYEPGARSIHAPNPTALRRSASTPHRHERGPAGGNENGRAAP